MTQSRQKNTFFKTKPASVACGFCWRLGLRDKTFVEVHAEHAADDGAKRVAQVEGAEG